WRVVWPDGSTHWLAGRFQIFYDETGMPRRMMGVNLDITARKRAEEERRQLEAKLQQTQKLESLGMLAGGIAHDFNNLLTGILGYTDLALVELPPGSSARPFIEGAVSGARRAADLTSQMLAYSGKGHFVVEPLDLSGLIAEMSRLLEISISKQCTLTYDLTRDLPSIEADATQIRQVIMNLVINASEAMSDNGGTVALSTGAMDCDRAYLSEVYLDENLPAANYVYLDVVDNGVGMSEETRARIFEPFFSTKFTGRGLGLAAVLGIVRGHRAALKVYTEPFAGTTFRVLFPAVVAPAISSWQRTPEATKWRGSGTVLVIDDEYTVRNLACRMLERLGFDAIGVADGREAVELFRANPAHVRLVLLDMTMPRMDGAAVFRELWQIRSDVQVILMSGYNEQTATSQFDGNPPAAFIQKPYRFEELRAAVRKTLD
ncbi:MAG TPA: response regulator, partial [Roseiflexaceae bacterium]|nr:response regulator [Roseiflexaceae bacterium]